MSDSWVLDCDDKLDGVAGCPVRHVENLRAAIVQQEIHQSQPVEFAFFTKEFEAVFGEQSALKDFYRLPETLVIDAGAVLRKRRQRRD